MTTRIYKNQYGDTISLKQSERLTDFEEQVWSEGRLKKSLKYFDNQLDFFTVYVYPDEDLAAEIADLTEADFTYTVAKDQALYDDYVVWKYYDLTNGILDDEYVMEVIDNENRVIAYATYDSSDTMIEMGRKDYFLSGKVLYDEDGEIDIAYDDNNFIRFDFSDGLSIDVDFDMSDPFSSVESFVDKWQELLPFMTPEVLTYFTNPEPLIPDVEL